MKILICSTNDNMGGAGRAAYRLLDGIYCAEKDVNMLVLHKNFENDLVFCVSDYHDQKNDLQKIFSVFKEKLKQRVLSKEWGRYPLRDKNAPVDDLSFSSVKNIFTKIDYDILHLHFIEDGFMDLREPGLREGPIVWTLHGCFPFTGICHYFSDCDKYKTECGHCPILQSQNRHDLSTKVFREKKIRYQDLNIHVITPSRWLGQRVKESALLGQRPVHVIPNGIDTDLFVPVDRETAKRALRLHDNKKNILFGAMSALSDYRKGYAQLQSAIKLLQKKYRPDDIRLIVFGASEIRKKDRTYFENVFLGQIINDRMLALCYSAADVMVVPSLQENLPNTIMESLACGTPVGAFNIGGNHDMIDHKHNGYLAEPYRVEDLAKGIRWCLENNNDNVLGENARRKVLNNFRIEDISKRYISLYESLIS